ncbi:MAG: hypothetical protein HQL79_12245, partial [Magnetococcales bacterium]|nr:hypothetical protein [Magnetococcales bacterium]
MNKLKLSAKLGLAFGLVLLMTIFVAVIGVNGFSSVVKRIGNSSAVNDIATESIVVLRAERNFIGDRKEEHLATAQKSVEAIKSQATEAREKMFQDPTDKENMSRIATLSEEFGKEFATLLREDKELQVVLEQIRGLSRNLLSAIDTLEESQFNKLREFGKGQGGALSAEEQQKALDDRIQKINAAADTAKQFLDARLGEKEVIITNGADTKSIQRVKDGLAKALAT